MTTKTVKSLELRAAEYVGREDLPRRSVVLAKDTVLIVWNDPKLCALIYTEAYGRRTGTTFMATPDRRRQLAALFSHNSTGDSE